MLKCAEAEVAEREPEREGAERTGELDGFFKEGEALDGIVGEGAGVVAGVGEGAARVGGIAIEEASAAGGLIEPLVRIERDRVGEIDPVECIRDGERSECAVGSIDVQPELELAAEVGDGAERVDAAGGGGSGAGDYGNGILPACDVAMDRVSRKSSMRMRKPSSTGMRRTASCPRPRSAAALASTCALRWSNRRLRRARRSGLRALWLREPCTGP